MEVISKNLEFSQTVWSISAHWLNTHIKSEHLLPSML